MHWPGMLLLMPMKKYDHVVSVATCGSLFVEACIAELKVFDSVVILR
jgi:hypothetical protein